MLGKPVFASRVVGSTKLRAEFSRDTGRLRIMRNGHVTVECFPPNSWFAIATVASYSAYGTRPNEQDLSLLLDDIYLRHPDDDTTVNLD